MPEAQRYMLDKSYRNVIGSQFPRLYTKQPISFFEKIPPKKNEISNFQLPSTFETEDKFPKNEAKNKTKIMRDKVQTIQIPVATTFQLWCKKLIQKQK